MNQSPASSKASELLPCPFCGNTDEVYGSGSGLGAYCDNCGADGPSNERDGKPVATWNRRTPLAAEAPDAEAVPVADVWPAVRKLISESMFDFARLEGQPESEIQAWVDERAPAGRAAPVASAITKELRALIEWAYDQGARFGEEVPAEVWFYEAEESGSITKRWHTAAPMENAEPVGNCCYGGRKPKSACGSCAAWEPVAQAAPAPANEALRDYLMENFSIGYYHAESHASIIASKFASPAPEAAPVAPDALPPLRDLPTAALQMELHMRRGPGYQCQASDCRAMVDGPGKWDTCPECKRKGYLCGSFKIDRESPQWKAWEARTAERYRAALSSQHQTNQGESQHG